MRAVRRKDREKSREFALAVVDKCDYAVMATVNPDGSPYCVPLSMAREGDWLFFHCALEGHKIDNLRFNNRVCVTCVGDVKLIPGAFGTEYKSAVINGTAEEITGKEEKTQALRVITKHYAPDDMPGFDVYIQEKLNRTGVWKIRINEISGKGRLSS